MSLKIPMRPQRFSHMSDPSELGMQLDRPEVLDIFPVEEHVSDRGGFLVDLEWVAG